MMIPGWGFAQSTPTFDDIRGMIEEYEAANPGKTMTIADVVARLPERYRAGFTLMYDSQSLQGSSFENPRVLMFGDDARTIISFNGAPDQRGYSDIEFAYVDQSTGGIVFRAMKFPAGDTGQGKVTYTEPNTPVCMACHGDNAHYIWDNFNLWPGAYGAFNDVLMGQEFDEFLKFRARAATHPRYQHLVYEFAELTPYAPYMPLEQNGGFVKPAIEYRPNTRLGILMTEHQAWARATEIARSPEFMNHRYGFAYFLAGCDTDFGSYRVDEMRQKTGQQDFLSYASALGSGIPGGWHMQKRPTAIPDYVYYPSLWSIRTPATGAIWEVAFQNEPELLQYMVPLRLSEKSQVLESHGLILTQRGLELWQAMDIQGYQPTTFAGMMEGQSYLDGTSTPVLSQEQAVQACKILADKQLSQ
jgi:hypothetical protein